jgi:hypothetical protein
MENLKKYVYETIEKYPNLKEEIMDLYQLCLDEIDEGGSIENECYLCEDSIKQLIEENKL